MSDNQTNSTDDSNQKPNFMAIVKQYVKILQLKMKKEDMIYLKEHNYNEYLKIMGEYVPEFKDNYPSLFQMIISGADLSMLELFYEKFNNIDQGKQTLNEARNELGQLLHDKYVGNNI
jgi:hypothetical protein